MAAPDPRDLIKREDVEEALKADQGPAAKLTSFEIKDFTSKGDNYACVVTSVVLSYKKDDKDLETTFVVKLNPHMPMPVMAKMSVSIFEKETGFYEQILPLLNRELDRLKQAPLRMPRHIYSVKTPNQEVIYLEDMRKKGFKMLDRKIGMDRNHTMLILKELAKLHAISLVLKETDEFKGINFVDKFPFVKELFTELMNEDGDQGGDNMMQMWFGEAMKTSADIAEGNKGYEYAGKFLRSLIPNISEVMTNILAPKEPFVTICHGDCWNNNFLYRYDDAGIPIECCLLDLQIHRVTSPMIDLNYMLYCSLNGDTRIDNLEDFFDTYYAHFASILAANNQPMKFTLSMLKEEFAAKNIFGLVLGTTLIPMFLIDKEEAPDMSDINEDDMEKLMLEHKEKIMRLVQKNPLLTSRFLTMFDEMKKRGIFDSVL